MADRDPAVEAADRACADNAYGPSYVEVAREALAPIRKLHRKAAVFVHADGCDNLDADHERLWHFEAGDGEMVCESLPPLGWTCAECAEVAAGADELPGWPCDTARLIYPADELAGEQS